jgi:translation elongation factor EF-Tu-like GTPase
MKTMSPVCDVKEWTTCVGVMMKSKIHGIELVARKVVWNDVGDESSQSLTLPKAVDEQDVECGIVLTQPSQETHADTDAEEPPFVVSNETVLNVEPI